MLRTALSYTARALMTGLAFWWIFHGVDLSALGHLLASMSRTWLAVGIGLFFLAQVGCIIRWKILVPRHASLTWGFLTNSFFVASFFNTFLPTTVGGDVIRSYDLIKATGQWRQPLASVLVDRLLGMAALGTFASLSWFAFAPARHDPVLRGGFFGFLLVAVVTFCVLGSRRILNGMLKPFSRIGLGQLESHAKQFQESLLEYFKHPEILLKAFGVSVGLQALAMLMFVSVARALHIEVPLLFLILTVPIVTMVAQLPISLNGWGVREGAAILLFERIGIDRASALSFSLVCAAIPLLAGGIGGILFLLRQHRRRRS